MYTSYRFNSARDINEDLIHSIRAAFQNKPVIVIVEEDNDVPEGMTSDMADQLEKRLQDNAPVFIDEKTSLNLIKDKYGIPH